MKDGDKQKNLERNSSRQHITNLPDVGSVFQPVRVRRGTIFSDIMDRKFMESELRFVLGCGLVFWVLFLLSQAF
jgi:hypothetical protein